MEWATAAVIIVPVIGIFGTVIAKIIAGREREPAHETSARSDEVAERLIQRFVEVCERAASRFESAGFTKDNVTRLQEIAKANERRLADLETQFKEIREPLYRWAMTTGGDKH